MKILLLADEIWQELGSPTDTSASSIAFWLRTNVGLLATQLGEMISIDSSGETVPDLDNRQCAIFKALYVIHYYDRQIRKHLGAAGVETVLEVSSDGGTVRRQNKTTLAQTYIQLRKQTADELEDLIADWFGAGALPLQVAGSDTVGRTFRIEEDVRNRNIF